jgi:hypothetical protein
VSVPGGAAVEAHVPEPTERVAVHSDVDPVERMTEPVCGPGAEVTVTTTE